jgi:acetyl-CoA C-acetyltransferase
VNQLCGSGLRAVALGYQAILNGDSDIVVAGGQESMSQAPHCQHLRNGVKMGNFELVDTMIKDGLWDAFNGYHMGTTAENVAKKWQITRQQQDEFAVKSQNKAEAAMKAGKFKDEIAPVTIKSRKGDIVVDTDEYPKAGVTLDSIAKLPPGLRQGRLRDGGQRLGHQRRRGRGGADEGVRGGQARQDAARAHRVLAHAGVDAGDHGTGPSAASRAALKKAGWNIATSS